jgi:hypothetical protein
VTSKQRGPKGCTRCLCKGARAGLLLIKTPSAARGGVVKYYRAHKLPSRMSSFVHLDKPLNIEITPCKQLSSKLLTGMTGRLERVWPSGQRVQHPMKRVLGHGKSRKEHRIPLATRDGVAKDPMAAVAYELNPASWGRSLGKGHEGPRPHRLRLGMVQPR